MSVLFYEISFENIGEIKEVAHQCDTSFEMDALFHVSGNPEEEIDRLIASLEAKDKTYIKILSYEFTDEYVSFRIFSQGKWDIKL